MDDFLKTKSTAMDGQGTIDKAAQTARDGIEATRRSAHEGFNKMSDKAEELHAEAAPLLEKATDRGQQLMQQARTVFDDTTQRVRAKAHDVSDTAISYTKGEPVKAMLMAAAAGAVLMSLLSSKSRSRR